MTRDIRVADDPDSDNLADLAEGHSALEWAVARAIWDASEAAGALAVFAEMVAETRARSCNYRTVIADVLHQARAAIAECDAKRREWGEPAPDGAESPRPAS